MSPEAGLQRAIEEAPGDEAAWLVLADWLEESGQPERAELLRLSVALRRGPDVPGRAKKERRMQALPLAKVKPWAPRRLVSLAAGDLPLVLVPPGTFRMGSPDGEDGRDEQEGPAHLVTLTAGFWMSECTVPRCVSIAPFGRPVVPDV